MQSPIIRMEVDQLEQYTYLACENYNVYQYPLGASESIQSASGPIQPASSVKRKTLSHKKRITAMCISTDGRQLVTGDAGGQIYVWTIRDKSDNQEAINSSTTLPVQTFDIHKDRGAISNLVALDRPLSLFGLTANMQGYEPGVCNPLKKQLISQQDKERFV